MIGQSDCRQVSAFFAPPKKMCSDRSLNSARPYSGTRHGQRMLWTLRYHPGYNAIVGAAESIVSLSKVPEVHVSGPVRLVRSI
jgi:hypothetical protein